MEFINEDLTAVDVAAPFLKECVGKGKTLPEGSVLQVRDVTNISLPTFENKGNYEGGAHVLKVTVTDGKSQGYALVLDNFPGMSLNTAPGTKIKITQPVLVHGGLFLLSGSNCQVLGGRVARLYDKWEAQKKMAFKAEWGYTGTSVEGEGPPLWKPFGYKMSAKIAAVRKMKTTDVLSGALEDKKENEEKSQFDLQRDEAILELKDAAGKQVFKKPNKSLLDKEIVTIMEEGFTQDVAEYAMSRFKNLHRALRFLKESRRREEGAPAPEPTTTRRHHRKKGRGDDDEEEQEVPAEFRCPSKNVSLFGFIQDRIKCAPEDSSQTSGSRAPAAAGGPSDDAAELENSMGRMSMEGGGDSFSGGRYNNFRRGRGHRGGRGGGRGRGQTRGNHDPAARGYYNSDRGGRSYTRGRQDQSSF